MHTFAPEIVRDMPELRRRVAIWRRDGQSVAVVPTMGALHEGHLSLVRQAKAEGGRVIVTIFVNPLQFNSQADLALYPRDEAGDAALLAGSGADLLYVPEASDMYPADFSTSVAVAGLTDGLCGANRVGHFTGMATVVTKLFLRSGADCAYFGEKDFQQLRVVQRMVRDLDLPIRVIGCPTIREADGLAMSSRNRRLPQAARAVAPALYRLMQEAAVALEAGGDVGAVLAETGAAVLAAGFARVEYLELRAEDDLTRLERLSRPARLLAACWLGEVRLIDNVPVRAPAGREDRDAPC